MAGIFTYMTGNWELLGNGLKDRKIPPRGRKWKGGLNSPGKEGGAMAGIFTYMTGNWELLGKWTGRQENSSTWQEVEGKA